MKLSYLFSGQGSQFKEMGQDLYKSEPIYRMTIEEASDVLSLDFKDPAIFDDIKNVQMAILTMSTGIFRILDQDLPSPVGATGLSLGEYSALTAADSLSFADTLKLVRDRSLYMEAAGRENPGKMAAVLKVTPDVLEHSLKKVTDAGYKVYPANYNTDNQVVIGGTVEGVEIASGYLKEAGARVVPLKVVVASHTPLMDPAARSLSQRLSDLRFNDPKFPVISNTTEEPFSESNVKKVLTQQLVEPTHFVGCIKKLFSLGSDTFIEVGPGKTLAKLAKSNLRGQDIKIFNIDSKDSLDDLRGELS